MEAIVGVRADDPQCGPDADASQAGLLKIFASLLARDDALAYGAISSSKKRVSIIARKGRNTAFVPKLRALR